MHYELRVMSCEENREKSMTGIKDDEVKIRLHGELQLSHAPTPSVGQDIYHNHNYSIIRLKCKEYRAKTMLL